MMRLRKKTMLRFYFNLNSEKIEYFKIFKYMLKRNRAEYIFANISRFL